MFHSDSWQLYKERREILREQTNDYRAKLRIRYWSGDIDIDTYRNLQWLNQCIDGVLHRRLCLID